MFRSPQMIGKMRFNNVRATIAVAVLVVFTNSLAVGFPAEAGQKFVRVELYFGFDRKGSEPVTEDDWTKFLADEVTPRFPSGFSVVKATGQYRGDDGSIVREESRVILLFFPKSDRKKNEAQIEAIRAAYKSKFNQESVLRLDFVKSVEVDY